MNYLLNDDRTGIKEDYSSGYICKHPSVKRLYITGGLAFAAKKEEVCLIVNIDLVNGVKVKFMGNGSNQLETYNIVEDYLQNLK